MPAHLDEEEGGASGQGEDSHTVGKVAPLNHETTLGIGASIPPGPLSIVRIVAPMEGSPHPGQADAQEDVHGVAACDVHDGGVRELVLQGRRPGGEEVRHGGAQGHEADGRDGVLEAGDAAEELGEVADHGREHADVRQRAEEADPAAAVDGRRHEQAVEQVPGPGEGGEDPLQWPWRLVVLVLAQADAVAARHGADLRDPDGGAQPHLVQVQQPVADVAEPRVQALAVLVLVADRDREDAALLATVVVGVEQSVALQGV
mmetsp:Transcript_6455/g.19943  ORF Transcript_6455/g.19943 Transcript_6455/m.19943 type:complete len:260 (+) Transcript_6455:445-1224(+)